MERLPFQATTGASPYDGIARIPVTMLLDHVRSAYNVGSFFRTADGAGLERLILCGITPRPGQASVSKTALGAEDNVAWDYHVDALVAVRMLRARGYEIVAVETSLHAVDLFDWRPAFPVCVLFGGEVDGLSDELLACCDTHVRLPMLGRKHSLNVATAGGIVAYELLRKCRCLEKGFK